MFFVFFVWFVFCLVFGYSHSVYGRFTLLIWFYSDMHILTFQFNFLTEARFEEPDEANVGHCDAHDARLEGSGISVPRGVATGLRFLSGVLGAFLFFFGDFFFGTFLFFSWIILVFGRFWAFIMGFFKCRGSWIAFRGWGFPPACRCFSPSWTTWKLWLYNLRRCQWPGVGSRGYGLCFFLNFVMFFFGGLFNFVVFFFCSSGTVLNLWSREKLSQDLQCATLDSPRSYKATNVSDAKMPFGYCFFAQRPVAHFFLGISGWVGVCWVRRRWIVTTFLSVLILSE